MESNYNKVEEVFSQFVYASRLENCNFCLKKNCNCAKTVGIRHPTSFFKFFNWRIIALDNFVVLWHASTKISHRYTHVPSLLNLPLISLPIPPFSLSQSPCSWVTQQIYQELFWWQWNVIKSSQLFSSFGSLYNILWRFQHQNILIFWLHD